MKVGDKRDFNEEKGKVFEIKEIINNAGLPLSWQYDMGDTTCSNCGTKLKLSSTRNYTIDTIEILEALDGQRVFIGYTKEIVAGRPMTMRLPDKVFYPQKDMTDAIKAKSNYLK